MKITSVQKYIRVSPKKLRDVAKLVRRTTPLQALEILTFVRKRAAVYLLKTIKVAVANAKALGLGEKDLVFKEIQIGDGPALKRGREVSRGRWHPIKKRMSNIRVVLETSSQKTKKLNVQNSKVLKPGEKLTKVKNGT